MENKINQKINGDGNVQQQIQHQIVNIITAELTESQIRDICSKNASEIAKTYFETAVEIANTRMKCLEDTVMNRFNKIENSLIAFSDPSFFLSYRSAQMSAATTDDKKTYEMLSELLLHRHFRRENKYTLTGVNGAIEIVNEIADSSLAALTILTCINQVIMPTTNILDEGLKALSDLYSAILVCPLPNDDKWMDQLDILKAIRIDNVNKFKKFKEIIKDRMPNYSCAGIKFGSREYEEALKIQKENNINVLVRNDLIEEEYYIVPLFSKNDVSTLGQKRFGQFIPLTSNQIDAVNKIISLYTKDNNINNKVLDALIKRIDQYEGFRKVHEWWDQLSNACHLTQIGKVLGHANAQNCCKNFPALD